MDTPSTHYLTESYFAKYTPEEIKCITQFELIEKRKKLLISFESIPEEKLEEVLACLRGKENIILEINSTDLPTIIKNDISFKGIEVDYICETVAQAQEEIINRFDKAQITVGRYDNINVEPLSLVQYKILLKKLRKMVQGISLNLPEGKRFKKVYVRVGKQLQYDNDIMEPDEELQEYQEINKNNSRNLVNALIYGRCVCSGMTETLKQALSLVGIKCINCQSESGIFKGMTMTHTFSMVRINNNWYNTDITWDEERIKRGMYPKYCLKSDEEFKKMPKKEDEPFHSKELMNVPECPKSLELFKGRKIINQIEKALNNFFARMGNILKKTKMLETPTEKQILKQPKSRKKFVKEITTISSSETIEQPPENTKQRKLLSKKKKQETSEEGYSTKEREEL